MDDTEESQEEEAPSTVKEVSLTKFVKAPAMWRKPRVKIYDYNRECGGNYYQPMIEYLNAKDNQGVYFEKPRDSIYLPEVAEVGSDKYNNARLKDQQAGAVDLDHFLVKAYSKQIKELNSSTANVHYHQLHGSKANTEYDRFHLLSQHKPANTSRNIWLRELMLVNNENTRREEEREALEEAVRAAMRRKREFEEYHAWRNNPDRVAAARETARAATYFYQRFPLSKEERKARLAGEKYVEKETDWEKMYYY